MLLECFKNIRVRKSAKTAQLVITVLLQKVCSVLIVLLVSILLYQRKQYVLIVLLVILKLLIFVAMIARKDMYNQVLVKISVKYAPWVRIQMLFGNFPVNFAKKPGPGRSQSLLPLLD